MFSAQCKVLLLICCFSGLTQAADGGSWDFSYEKKMKCSHGNMMQMNECLAREYAETDKHLNIVYGRLLNALADPSALKKAQKAWIVFRDEQCAFEVPKHSGSEYPYSQRSCLIDHAERRIKDLERVQPCNGCVEFKEPFYKPEGKYELPPRQRKSNTAMDWDTQACRSSRRQSPMTLP